MPFFSLLYIFAQNLDVLWVKWKNKFLSKQVWIFDSYYFGGGNGNCSHKFSVHNCILVLLCGIFINDNYLWFNRVVKVLQKQKPREGMVAVCWQNIPNTTLSVGKARAKSMVANLAAIGKYLFFPIII